MRNQPIAMRALSIAIGFYALSGSAVAQISIGQPFPDAGSSIEWLKGPPLPEFERDRMAYALGEDKSGFYTSHVRTRNGSISLPTLVIVDRQGRIAWKRHGFDLHGLEPALEQIIAGSWDLARAMESDQRFADREADATRLLHRLNGPKESTTSIGMDLIETRVSRRHRS